MHPSIALSDFIKEIKAASNKWMKGSGRFPDFGFWAEGYCALTYNYGQIDAVRNYIVNQKEHHRKVSFEDEYKALLEEHNIRWDEKYIF